jgi:hypothetical protein
MKIENLERGAALLGRRKKAVDQLVAVKAYGVKEVTLNVKTWETSDPFVLRKVGEALIQVYEESISQIDSQLVELGFEFNNDG